MYGEKDGDAQHPPTLPEANRHEQEDGTILAVAATGKCLTKHKILNNFVHF